MAVTPPPRTHPSSGNAATTEMSHGGYKLQGTRHLLLQCEDELGSDHAVGGAMRARVGVAAQLRYLHMEGWRRGRELMCRFGVTPPPSCVTF